MSASSDLIVACRVLPPGYAEGYEPTQVIHANARDPFEWDEVGAYHMVRPLFISIMRLGRARILQGLLDLNSKDASVRNLAVSWIFSNTSDFSAWCSDAGYSAKIVRHKARDIIVNGLHWRAEPNKKAVVTDISQKARAA